MKTSLPGPVSFAWRPARWYTSPVFDYTPKARRKRRRRRRLVPLFVGLVVVAGFGSVVARNLPPSPAGSTPPDQDLAAVARSSQSPVATLRPTPTPGRSVAPGPTPMPTPTPVPTAAPASALTGYRWPLPHGRLTLPFGPSPWGSHFVDGKNFHDGVDLATFCGDRIVAAHDGVVLVASRRYDDFIGWIGDLSRYKARLDAKKLWGTLPIVIVIDDGDGYRSVYAHFSKVVVKKGEAIKAGDFLGYEGRTGRASGCHLHFGLFSPLETARFGMDLDVIKRLKLPGTQIARIDPLLVLPPRPQDQPSASASIAPATPSPPPVPNPYP